MLPVAMVRYSFDGTEICTSDFVDDVMFSHSGANGPQSKTTPKFCPVARRRHRRRSLPSPTASCVMYVTFSVCYSKHLRWLSTSIATAVGVNNKERRMLIDSCSHCRKIRVLRLLRIVTYVFDIYLLRKVKKFFTDIL